MAGLDAEVSSCDRCGVAVEDDATEVVVRKKGRTDRTVLCPDCSELECPNCGTHVPFGAGTKQGTVIRQPSELVECAKCSEQVPPEEAAQLRNLNNPQYSKTLCGDCLQDTAVPDGFKIVRDFDPESA